MTQHPHGCWPPTTSRHVTSTHARSGGILTTIETPASKPTGGSRAASLLPLARAVSARSASTPRAAHGPAAAEAAPTTCSRLLPASVRGGHHGTAEGGRNSHHDGQQRPARPYPSRRASTPRPPDSVDEEPQPRPAGRPAVTTHERPIAEVLPQGRESAHAVSPSHPRDGGACAQTGRLCRANGLNRLLQPPNAPEATRLSARPSRGWTDLIQALTFRTTNRLATFPLTSGQAVAESRAARFRPRRQRGQQ